jgi:hypothetical protein
VVVVVEEKLAVIHQVVQAVEALVLLETVQQ